MNEVVTTNHYEGLNYKSGRFTGVNDVLAVEVPLSIAVNDTPFTVTMQTPGNEEELVRGILFSEFVYRDNKKPEIEITATNGDGYITSVNVTVPEELVLKDFAGNRNTASVSSCGMCGKISIEEEGMPAKITSKGLADPSLIQHLFESVSIQQSTFNQSGGTHAAGAFTHDGTMLAVREDIGRHNAVDKVIGFLLNNHLLDKVQYLTVSGRVSYEIVSKALSAGIPCIAAVSAPSSLAVEFARSSGIVLMAFCRNDKLTIYSNTDQVMQHEWNVALTSKLR